MYQQRLGVRHPCSTVRESFPGLQQALTYGSFHVLHKQSQHLPSTQQAGGGHATMCHHVQAQPPCIAAA